MLHLMYDLASMRSPDATTGRMVPRFGPHPPPPREDWTRPDLRAYALDDVALPLLRQAAAVAVCLAALDRPPCLTSLLALAPDANPATEPNALSVSC